MSYSNPVTPKRAVTWTMFGVAVFIGTLILLMGVIWGFRAFNRTQTLADARNRVRVSQIEIRNQEQRVRVAQQQAEIRHEEAKGVRLAQDEINKTLTPLYVQHEMVQALKDIAASGKNNSVVYLPSGANGVPLVATVNPNQVTQADG